MFSMGILNAHGGDLPRYRGNACQAWAIINGEKQIGLCIHKMIGGELDSGDIISKSFFNIENKRIGYVYNWMDIEIPKLFLESIKKLQQKEDYILEKQSKNYKDALRCYPRMPEDGLIDWSMRSIEIVRLINASSEPYSGAYIWYLNDKLIVWRASIIEDNEKYLGVCGQITFIDQKDGSIFVLTGNQTKVRVEEIEYKGIRCRPFKLFKSLRSRL
jgi:UDP-4-amino-4-deoxy-L-arabinose formyltransferase/UDP-glucuronic acid dehydrogenase (UDP-4-keto-hexauronic acid decarboxylating)